MNRSDDPEIVAKVRAILGAGGTILKVKQELRISYMAVANICEKHGIEKPSRSRSLASDDLARSMLAQGATLKAIATACKCSVAGVKRWMDDNGLSLPVAQKQKAQLPAWVASTTPGASARSVETPAPCLISRYGLSDVDRATLVETGGRYRDLRIWAEARGLTLVQAQQRWHTLGLSVVKGAE